MVVEGDIPKDLQGTFFRNGAGSFQIGNHTVEHGFDGDGYIASLSFKNGRAFFRSRFVRTKQFVAERRVGKALYRRSFSKGHPLGFQFNLDLTVQNVANTGVFAWGDRLFALYEQGRPHELRARDLSTVSESTLDATLEVSKLHAHYRKITHPVTGEVRVVSFGSENHSMDYDIHFYEHSPSGKLLHKRKLYLPEFVPTLFHDIAVTENYYVLYRSPLKLDYARFFLQVPLGQSALGECMSHDTEQRAQVLIVPRWGTKTRIGLQEDVVVAECGCRVALHHFNAYEWEQNGQRSVVLDTVTYGNIDFEKTGSVTPHGTEHFGTKEDSARPYRIVVNLATGLLHEQLLLTRMGEMPCVSPTVTSRPHKHMYYSVSLDPVISQPPRGISKVTVQPHAGVGGFIRPGEVCEEVHVLGATEFVNELCVIPKPGSFDEDDCWVLAYTNDGATMQTYVVILDGQNVGGEPVAKIKLPVHIPQGLHGWWSGEVYMEVEGEYLEPGKVVSYSIDKQ